jgi:hypothetical protein
LFVGFVVDAVRLQSINERFDDDFFSKSHCLKAWNDAAVIVGEIPSPIMRIDLTSQCCVGLHPDEPTEQIVDYALQHHKPFAVLPCCVFPKSNRQRRLRDGAPVRSWSEFCRFLCEKDERIERAELPMQGRNVVVFWRGDEVCDDEQRANTTTPQ